METSRDRLVTAMSDLMWERGYAATSPREVRERSGVGQGGMYHRFSGKHALALAALERNCADLLPGSLELLEGEGNPLRGCVPTCRGIATRCAAARSEGSPRTQKWPPIRNCSPRGRCLRLGSRRAHEGAVAGDRRRRTPRLAPPRAGRGSDVGDHTGRLRPGDRRAGSRALPRRLPGRPRTPRRAQHSHPRVIRHGTRRGAE